ncbi:hypothetical protein AB4Y30_03255 [Ornithinibacillus sp. 4-3]|uniref:Uncharacterized protein n=1 Tax=Ornithinibacillus sp. 4-3 TaxID=3231488 RepID=A0AB39HST0_9BACI
MEEWVKAYLEMQGIKRDDETYKELAVRWKEVYEHKGDFQGLKEANIILHYTPKGSDDND